MAGGPVAGQMDSQGNYPATQRQSAGGAADGQTLFQFAANPSINAGYTSPTIVTPSTAIQAAMPGGPVAAKTAYVTDIYVGSNTAVPFLVTLLSGATPIWYGYCKGDTGPIQFVGVETQPQVAAGQALTVQLGTAAATTAAVYVAGFVQ